MLAASFLVTVASARPQTPATTERDFVTHDFKFHSGESLPECAASLHDRWENLPVTPQGRTTNAVLILHGTGGSGHQFLAAYFASELIWPRATAGRNALLYCSAGRNWPTGNRRSRAMAYTRIFRSMTTTTWFALHYKLLNDGLGVNHLRLIFGTSMGCMHSFVWGRDVSGFYGCADAMACLPVQIAGRNRVWRKIGDGCIRTDPEWKGGRLYNGAATGPSHRARLSYHRGEGVPRCRLQKERVPTRADADKYLDKYFP